jgi:hypothetical protein
VWNYLAGFVADLQVRDPEVLTDQLWLLVVGSVIGAAIAESTALARF